MVGRIVAGRFELERQAGAGGMGTIYCARDLTTGQRVAIKLLNLLEGRGAERFDAESEILAELAHPAIVRHVAHGVTENGERYLAMEWLQGEDLGARLGRSEDDPLTPSDSLILIRRAAEALAYTHPRGIVHRDIKPENLFLPEGDVSRLKLLDFGIARMARAGRRLTATGSVVGTPGYMAPEVLRGVEESVANADIFSLGCVLFHCLSGRPAFEAEDPTALMAKILLQDAPRLREFVPQIPESLEQLLVRMLEKDPSARPADGAALVVALDALPQTLDLELGERPQRRRLSLTASEQRIACVVMAGPSDISRKSAEPGQGPPGKTLHVGMASVVGDAIPVAIPSSSTPIDPRLTELESVLSLAHGARTHALPDGTLVVTMSDVGKPKDHVTSAARCALLMRTALPGVPIVVATGPGRFSAWSVAGEVIDVGARLLRVTAPGAIRLDDVAAGLLDVRFEVEKDGPSRFLKNEREAFATNSVLLGKNTDFVGRGREISMLTNLHASVITESTAAAVLVTGPAGIGKSRLRQEFVDWVRRQPDHTEILFGAGDSLSSGGPFGMLGRALRRSAGIHDSESLDVRRAKLRERVARHVEPASRTRIAAFLGELAGTTFADDFSDVLRSARQSAQLMSDGIRRAWEDWLAAECKAGPVLILLEDLHWGDLGTVTLVDAALRTLRESPLMVMAFARPDVTATFPDLWSERELQTIRLAPLSRKAAEKLVREALGTKTDPTVIAQVVERADGNAFFLEELIRARAEGRGGTLPNSVLGTVQSRLDAEGADIKRVLRAASIFGERFNGDDVVALLGGPREAENIRAWLDHIEARELIARAAEPRSAGGVAYVFSHALVREAAYAMLTEDDRVLGHRLAGDWLEPLDVADPMTLAEHFRRGEEPSRAVRWYHKAAEQALNANDLAAAIERAGLGLSCGAGGELAGALRLTQAEAHLWRGELDRAEERAREAVGELTPGTSAWLRANGQVVIAAAKRGDLDRVEAQVQLVTSTLPEFGARNAEIVCLSWAANYLIFGGRVTAAENLLLMIGDLAGDLSEVDAQAVALVRQVNATRASSRGELGTCVREFREALAAFEQAGDLRNACAVRSNLAYIYSELGDFERAETALRAALEAADRMGLHDVTAQVQHNLGRVLEWRGQLIEARALEQKAVDSFAKQGDPRLEGVARAYLAEIALDGGQTREAEHEASVAMQLLKVAPSLRVPATAIWARALVALHQPREGLAAAEEAFRALATLGDIEEGEAMVRLAYAECLIANGANNEANIVLRNARDRLLSRASRITEDTWRERFLHDVPSHKKTLSLAGQCPPSQ